MSCFPRYWLKHLVHLQLRTNFTPCKFSATELSKDVVAASLHLHCCMGFDITEQRWEWSKILPRLIILCWTYFMMFPWFHRKLVRIVSGQSVSIHMCFNREDWYSQNSQLTYFFFSAGRLVVTLLRRFICRLGCKYYSAFQASETVLSWFISTEVTFFPVNSMLITSRLIYGSRTLLKNIP